MKANNIAFIVSSATSLGVLESQLFSFANYLCESLGRNVKIILVGKEIKFNQSNYSEKIEFYYLNQTIRISEIENYIVYIRTIDIFIKNFLSLKLKGNKIFYDFRALLFAESHNRHKNRLKSTIIFLLEMLVYVLADRVGCVSNQLRSKLHRFFLIKRKVFVFPCLNMNAEYLFKSKHLTQDMVKFVYLGGLSEWQMFDKVLELYQEISTSLKFKSDLTIITRDHELALQKLEQHAVKAEVKGVDNKFIAKELKKYNFGFLIRQNTLLNNVSSPIKYLEYLSSGVIPIMSEGIGDYSKEAQERNLALVIDNDQGIPLDSFIRIKQDSEYQNRLKIYLEQYSLEKRIMGHPLITL